jgi:holo-[acyl-carrier-protein] synthase
MKASKRAAPRPAHLRLGVNIDHVATIRNARGGRHPDPLRAAHIAIAAGADGITAHLREDRRHISDDDIARLKRELTRPLNFEMAATDEMLAIALRHVPHACCLVPEKREERTTEGGLDVVRGENELRRYVDELKAAGIRVSLFIRARPHLQHRRRRRPRSRDRRAQHRPLPGGRGHLRRARPGDHAHACPDGRCPCELAAGRAGKGCAMILGLGNDIIDIRRIEQTLERYGERFLNRVFTDTERRKSEARVGRAASYAKRFAAKEACAKALGTGLRKGVFWRDMGVVNLRSGRPTIVLTGGAAEQLRRITPEGLEARVDVSLTDDFPLAQAIVVISAVPAAKSPKAS